MPVCGPSAVPVDAALAKTDAARRESSSRPLMPCSKPQQRIGARKPTLFLLNAAAASTAVPYSLGCGFRPPSSRRTSLHYLHLQTQSELRVVVPLSLSRTHSFTVSAVEPYTWAFGLEQLLRWSGPHYTVDSRRSLCFCSRFFPWLLNRADHIAFKCLQQQFYLFILPCSQY